MSITDFCRMHRLFLPNATKELSVGYYSTLYVISIIKALKNKACKIVSVFVFSIFCEWFIRLFNLNQKLASVGPYNLYLLKYSTNKWIFQNNVIPEWVTFLFLTTVLNFFVSLYCCTFTLYSYLACNTNVA